MPNLHLGDRSGRPAQIGAADDDAQPAANGSRWRLQRVTDPTRIRGSRRFRADIARMLTKAEEDSKRARRSKREGGTSTQRSRSRNKAADRVLTLTSDISSSITCRRVSSRSPSAVSPARAVDPGHARSTPGPPPRNDKPPAKARGDRGAAPPPRRPHPSR